LAAAQEEALQTVIVDIDSEFIHNNQLYRVTEVGAFGIHATCIIPPTDEVRQFGEEYVTQPKARVFYFLELVFQQKNDTGKKVRLT
jgi:hypothetical protein